MTSNDNNKQATSAAETAPPENMYTDSAAAMVDRIHAMQADIPKFSIPSERNSTQRLASVSSVPLQFVEKVATLVKDKPFLTGDDTGPAKLRDLLAFAAAYAPVADEMEALAGGLRHTIRDTLNEAGASALTAYEVAKRKARRAAAADLLPHIADMKRLLKTRFPGRKKAPRPAPEP